MKLETDPERIEKLAGQKKDANWAFRCFLKTCDLSVEELDAIVHKLYQSISGQIDCRQCANCCKVVQPVLKSLDIERLAISLGLPVEELMARYLQEDEEENGYCFKTTPCPFLNDNLCTVYPHRPYDCRSYPHLHKNDFFFRINGAYHSCSVCPIVYNVYERLKEEMRRRQVRSYPSKY